MKPSEMAARLKELAEGDCGRRLGPDRYDCLYFDPSATIGDPCERCQAAAALEDLRQPWKTDCADLREKLRGVRRIVQEDA